MAFIVRDAHGIPFIISQHDHAVLARELARVMLPLMYPDLSGTVREHFLQAVGLHDFVHGTEDLDDILNAMPAVLRPIGHLENMSFLIKIHMWANKTNMPAPVRGSVVLHWMRLTQKWEGENFREWQKTLQMCFQYIIPSEAQQKMLTALDMAMDTFDGMALRICGGVWGDHIKKYRRSLPGGQILELPFSIEMLQGDKIGIEIKVAGLSGREKILPLIYHKLNCYPMDDPFRGYVKLSFSE